MASVPCSPLDTLAVLKAAFSSVQPPAPPPTPGPLTDEQTLAGGFQDGGMPPVALSRLADLKGCQLGPSFVVLLSLCTLTGLYSSTVGVGPHLDLVMHVHCRILQATSFNQRMIDIRQQGTPYTIMHTNGPLPGKVLHVAALEQLQEIIRGTGVAVEFSINFGAEMPSFSLVVTDFSADPRILDFACGLAEQYQHPQQLSASTDLALLVSTDDARAFEKFSRAVRSVRKMEKFRYFNNSIARRTSFINPSINRGPAVRLTRSSQKHIVLEAFLCKSGILDQLLDEPFNRAKILRPVEWRGEPAVVEVRARAHRSAVGAARTRRRWCNPLHKNGATGFPRFVNPLHSLDYATQAALTGNGVPKDAVTALLLLVLTVSPIASISLGVYLHTPDKFVRLLGYVCPTKDGNTTPLLAIGFCHRLSVVIKRRFGLVVRDDISSDDEARTPSELFMFNPPKINYGPY